MPNHHRCLRITVLVLMFLSGTLGAQNKQNNNNNNAGTTASCTDPNISPSKLTSNTFHKICPTSSSSSSSLGQPICGDGSAFSFVYTSPSQLKQTSEDKIIIEFQGGGACWSGNSCNGAGNRLKVSNSLDAFVGYSCSVASMVGTNVDGYPVNFLCDTTIGSTDFSSYHYILVPYCTQDIHLGDNVATYDNGSIVYHHGAHNTMSVLNWVFQHFQSPSHIFLTGCSAGGSPLPVVYDLVNQHYNSFLSGGRTVNINTILDSAVYLTPKYFMNNYMANWNTNTVLQKVKFDKSLEFSVQYSTYLWNHALERGSDKDQWGFLSHTKDPVSMAYWQAMGAGYYGDEDGEDCDSWYNDMSNSLSYIEGSHSNMQSFFIDGQGHCSLGLYYGMKTDGFDSWASSIVEEQTIFKQSIVSIFSMGSSAGAQSSLMFSMSVIIATVVMLSALLWKSKEAMSGNDKVGPLLSNEWETSPSTIPTKSDHGYVSQFKTVIQKVIQKITTILTPIMPYGKRFADCPITTFYFITTSLYFLCMLSSGGFTHPLDNPSLGPSANVLSQFGINNPTLVVSKKQIGRILVSGFMCSGVVTFLFTILCIFRVMRHTEKRIQNTTTFAVSSFLIMIGSNLIYTMFGNGASCGSLAFVLGINVFSIGLEKKLRKNASTTITNMNGTQTRVPWCSTFLLTIVGVTLLPFNSWIMIAASMSIGVIVSTLFVFTSAMFLTTDRDVTNNEWMPKAVYLFPKSVMASYITMGVMLLLILVGVPQPKSMYEYPYLTGCNMMYSTDIAALMDKLGGGGRRHLLNLDDRRLEGGGGGGNNDFNLNNAGCAQMCVPHLIEKPFYIGLKTYIRHSGNNNNMDDYSLNYGMCKDVGYGDFLVDTTLNFWGFSSTVEVYDVTQNN